LNNNKKDLVMRNKVLVTGGSGFIGTNLVKVLVEQGFKVWNLDLNAPRADSQSPMWLKGDIGDAEQILQILRETSPDYIIHLAARTDLGGSSLSDYADNTKGTQNIIHAANVVGSVKRLIFASTMLVYRCGYVPVHDADYSPDTVYGESKVQMEKMIRESDLSCEWAIIRPTSIWGPWFGEPYKRFFDLVLAGKYVHPGHRSCTKTFGYVGNSVLQILALLKGDAAQIHARCFYIGDDPPIHISDWADEIRVARGNGHNKRIPYLVMLVVAHLGDLLNTLGIQFPMTTFRLRNMTTDNIIDLRETLAVVGPSAFSRASGVTVTLRWLESPEAK